MTRALVIAWALLLPLGGLAAAEEPQSLTRPGNPSYGEKRNSPAPKAMGFNTALVLVRPGRSSGPGGSSSPAPAAASTPPAMSPAPTPSVFGGGPSPSPMIRNPLSTSGAMNVSSSRISGRRGRGGDDDGGRRGGGDD